MHEDLAFDLKWETYFKKEVKRRNDRKQYILKIKLRIKSFFKIK